jgi:hypothetical protein
LALSALLPAACASAATADAVCAAGQTVCAAGAQPKVVVDADEWNHASDPRGLMVRIQSNLDRVSAGQPAWPAPPGAMRDPLEGIVDAYSDFLHGDFKDMDAQLAVVPKASARATTATETRLQASNKMTSPRTQASSLPRTACRRW